jgi:hypothetical protein
MQTGSYLIEHGGRYLGLRHQKQTFINLHDSTSIFRLRREAGNYYLMSKDDKYLTPAEGNEVILQPRKNSAAAISMEESGTSGLFYLKTSVGSYIKASRYELRQSDTKTDDCKLGFLDTGSVASDEPEWFVWGGSNPDDLTPPEQIIRERGFQHKAPTAGVFNWILNTLFKGMNYLNIKRLAQREDHEQLDDYVRRRVLDIDEDLGDAIRAAEEARTASELAQADAETAADGAESSENACRQYAGSALSSKNLAVSSAATATLQAGSASQSSVAAALSETNAAASEQSAKISQESADASAISATADAATASNHATAAASAETAAERSEQTATAAKNTAVSAKNEAKNYKISAKNYSDLSYNSYTKSHSSAEKARIQAEKGERSATAAGSSAGKSAASAREAATSARESKQDYSEIMHMMDLRNINIDYKEIISHQRVQHVNTLFTNTALNCERGMILCLTFTGSMFAFRHVEQAVFRLVFRSSKTGDRPRNIMTGTTKLLINDWEYRAYLSGSFTFMIPPTTDPQVTTFDLIIDNYDKCTLASIKCELEKLYL